MAQELHDGQLKNVVKANQKKLVAVDFGNPGCPPCRAIKPWWNTLPRKYPTVVFCSIECDNCPSDSREYQITATPTFVFIVNGKEVNRILGPNKPQILSTIEKYKTSGDPFAGQSHSINSTSQSNSSSKPTMPIVDNYVRDMLLEMGFSQSLTQDALKFTNNGTIDECILYLERVQNLANPQLKVPKPAPSSESNTSDSSTPANVDSQHTTQGCVLKVILPNGDSCINEFDQSQTLSDVFNFVVSMNPGLKGRNVSFETAFPKNIYTQKDFSKTLSQCKIVKRAQIFLRIN
ncbi:Thioredoxin family protein [Histomonas meleagridis]|uniref:Thioredoxin family protein n=1 Tax=Histomonas meleagridis TaxID=135588 RepID=UPI00355AAE69|nr:Thioredoxin family protein [Histomonas meleagridis]KAH0804577.1 Thioredoxin family protein [Histomonas meleagridis]